MDFLSQHVSELVSALVGAAGGSLLTFKFMSNKSSGRNHATGGSTLTDQTNAKAGHSNVGRNQYNIGSGANARND